MNSGAPFTSSTAKLRSGRGIKIHACELRSRGCRGRHRELARVGLGLHGMACRAQRHVRPPLPGRGDAAHRPDGAPAGHEDTQVVAGGRDELLQEGAVTPEPRTPAEPLEEGPELVRVGAGSHPFAATPEARLDHGGEAEARHVVPPRRGAQVGRLRMGEPGAAEAERGDELVVAGEERVGAVEDGHASALQAAELGDARLDSVQRRPYVQVGEDEIPRPRTAGSFGRRCHSRLEADPHARSDEGGGNARLVAGDDEEPHRP